MTSKPVHGRATRGQSYLGARFPAHPAYAPLIMREAALPSIQLFPLAGLL